jgi:DNA-binding IclR family transcriptional regulator
VNRTDYAAPAVDRTLDIAELLADSPAPRGINELARALRIPANSVFRILRCLARRGYAEVDPQTGSYRLGAGFFRLGMRLAGQFELRVRARPALERLSAATGETCQLHVPDGDRVMAADVVTPRAEFYVQVVPGSRMHYHCNAFGKCILAFWPAAKVKKALPARLPAMTPETITNRDRLVDELESIRRTGLGYDREEYVRGVFCVGAPVFGVSGEVVGGVGVTGLTVSHGKEHWTACERAVLGAAREISESVGYIGDFFARLA